MKCNGTHRPPLSRYRIHIYTVRSSSLAIKRRLGSEIISARLCSAGYQAKLPVSGTKGPTPLRVSPCAVTRASVVENTRANRIIFQCNSGHIKCQNMASSTGTMFTSHPGLQRGPRRWIWTSHVMCTCNVHMKCTHVMYSTRWSRDAMRP